MSTKAIREALEAFATLAGGRQHIEKALSEVEAIEKAARVLVRPIPEAGLSFQECCELDDAKATLEGIAQESGQ